MMRVTVRVQGHLWEYFPQLAQPRVVEVTGPATMGEILGAQGVAPELPGAVLCNDVRVPLTHVPSDGDLLTLLSPMSGG